LAFAVSLRFHVRTHDDQAANSSGRWAYNFNENPVGEIDIIEGINKQDSNDVSLHTCGACTFENIGGRNPRKDCNNGGTISEQCEDGTHL
jgi:hypothetical protein